MISHPLALGKIKNSIPILYTVNTPQRIKLLTIKLKNTDGGTVNVAISLFSRGQTVGLTDGVATTPIESGKTLELIADNKVLIIDQGTLILAGVDKDNVIEYIIDGGEDFTMES